MGVEFIIPLVAVALSAGIGAFVALVVAKSSNETAAKSMKLQAEVEIARFREQWIHRLRDSLAEFQALGTVPNSNPRKSVEFYKLGTKIELMMNPSDPDFKELQQLMYEYLHVSEGELVEKYMINPEFISVGQRILKREWERLKKDLRPEDQIHSGTSVGDVKILSE